MYFDKRKFFMVSSVDDSTLKRYENDLLKHSSTLDQLYRLDLRVHSIIQKIEKNGLEISNHWLSSMLDKYRAECERISKMVGFTNYNHNDKSHRMKLKKHCNTHQMEDLTEKFYKWSCSIKDPKRSFRIYGEWTSYSSYSGRVTAKQHPLTNMPKKMRQCILPSSPNGYVYSIDMRNAEIRWLAYLSQDRKLQSLFSTGDAYEELSKIIRNEIEEDDLSISLREVCKTSLILTLYGAGIESIMSAINSKSSSRFIGKETIKIIVDFIFKEFKASIRWIQKQQSKKKLTTYFGEIYPAVDIKKSTKRNFALQACVATTLRLLMIEAERLDLKILHIIHDEVIVETSLHSTYWMEALEENLEKEIKKTHPDFNTKDFLLMEELK